MVNPILYYLLLAIPWGYLAFFLLLGAVLYLIGRLKKTKLEKVGIWIIIVTILTSITFWLVVNNLPTK